MDICGVAHLRPIKLSDTVGMRPLMTCQSHRSGSCSMPSICAKRKRMTAMMSCMSRKNNGTSVVFRTHLLLSTTVSDRWKLRGQTGDIRHNHLAISQFHGRKVLQIGTHRQCCDEVECHRTGLADIEYTTCRGQCTP